MAKWAYWECEGAIFRGPDDSLAEEIWTGKAWAPYLDARAKPPTFGDPIAESDLPDGATED